MTQLDFDTDPSVQSAVDLDSDDESKASEDERRALLALKGSPPRVSKGKLWPTELSNYVEGLYSALPKFCGGTVRIGDKRFGRNQVVRVALVLERDAVRSKEQVSSQLGVIKGRVERRIRRAKVPRQADRDRSCFPIAGTFILMVADSFLTVLEKLEDKADADAVQSLKDVRNVGSIKTFLQQCRDGTLWVER